MSTRGFTLIELLIAITLIGILAAVLLTAQAESRKQAQAAALLVQFEQLEKAMKLYMVTEERTAWPRYTSGNQTDWLNDHVITRLASDSPPAGFEGFDEYFVAEPVAPLDGLSFGYDARFLPSTCTVSVDVTHPSHFNGVSIRLPVAGGANSPLITDIVPRLDELVDDGDGAACGKIKWGGGSYTIYYVIAEDETDI